MRSFKAKRRIPLPGHGPGQGEPVAGMDAWAGVLRPDSTCRVPALPAGARRERNRLSSGLISTHRNYVMPIENRSDAGRRRMHLVRHHGSPATFDEEAFRDANSATRRRQDGFLQTMPRLVRPRSGDMVELTA
jgi:hypothetical protein